MELIKRKISLEDSTDRTYNSPNWGVVTATTFYLNVMITQNIDDMGLFTDIPYISASTNTVDQPDYTILANKLSLSGLTFPFMTGSTPVIMTGITGTTEMILRLPSKIESNHYNYSNLRISGYTDTKMDNLITYKSGSTYVVGFDMLSEQYTNYINTLIIGVSRVVVLSEPSIYVFDTPVDVNIGTTSQIYGLQYTTYSGLNRSYKVDNKKVSTPITTVRYIGEGWNETNVSLSALTKEEYLFGIISPPEVQSDVQIDRGTTTVMDRHLRLSEIKNLGGLTRYGNGFYNLTR